jgi:hypothetical protein
VAFIQELPSITCHAGRIMSLESALIICQDARMHWRELIKMRRLAEFHLNDVQWTDIAKKMLPLATKARTGVEVPHRIPDEEARRDIECRIDTFRILMAVANDEQRRSEREIAADISYELGRLARRIEGFGELIGIEAPMYKRVLRPELVDIIPKMAKWSDWFEMISGKGKRGHPSHWILDSLTSALTDTLTIPSDKTIGRSKKHISYVEAVYRVAEEQLRRDGIINQNQPPLTRGSIAQSVRRVRESRRPPIPRTRRHRPRGS